MAHPRPLVGALSAAALDVGRRAWHAGQDIEFAVTAAGYSAALARGVYEYFTQHAVPALEEASQSQSTEMAPQVKRQRTAKKDVPVAKSVKTYVKRCMDRVIEDKWTQSSSVSTMNPGVAGTVTQLGLELIQRGTSANMRVGNHIRPKFLRMRISARNDGANIDGQRVRFLIVQDNQCNGAAAAVTDVLGFANVLAPYNPLYVVGCGGKRFKVLYDTTIDINQPITYVTNTATLLAQISNETKVLKFDKSKLPATIGYDADTGTVADLADKNIFMVSVADDAQCALYYTTWWCFQDA